MTAGPILVTGAHGQVGRELIRRAPASGLALRALDRAQLDITDRAAIRAAVEGCSLVVNAAAYTAVDRAETDRAACHAVNAIAPGLLAEACAGAGIGLIHLSTDYVFDGAKDGAYVEDDPIRPLSAYGAAKAAGEAAVRERLARHVILRTTWLYAAHGANFLRTMLRLGAERDALRVVADQRGAPTPAADVALAVLAIIHRLAAGDGPWGTYHYTASGETTWHGFAEAIFALAAPLWGRRPQVAAIATADYPTPARRPANSVLDCTKIMADFAPMRRDWRDGLAAVMAEAMAPPRE